MNMLIVAGLMALGLLGIVGAIFLAMGEEKIAPQSKETPATPTAETQKEPITEQHLPAIRENSQAVAISSQFRELTAQLRVLHQQAQEIEHRLSLLTQAADHIERSQATSISVEEADDYSLPEPVANAV